MNERAVEGYPDWREGWKECATCLDPIYWNYPEGRREHLEPAASNCSSCAPEEWRKAA